MCASKIIEIIIYKFKNENLNLMFITLKLNFNYTLNLLSTGNKKISSVTCRNRKKLVTIR